MRVLRTEGSDQKGWTPRLCTFISNPKTRIQDYAILSHRWFGNANHEVPFADIEEVDRYEDWLDTDRGSVTVVKNAQYSGTIVSRKPGFTKIKGAASHALKDGYEYIWIDTCCIDKSSSAELSEAINSMFKWYLFSAVCYVYLMDVPDTTDTSDDSFFSRSQWWERGWTLQELLAPFQVLFFSSDWGLIGNRDELSTRIATLTGISKEAFNPLRQEENGDFSRFSVAQRMSWASRRTTSRPEDIAYCLMGLLDVNMPILYGEGDKAFLRLQQEIMKESDDESIFAWRDDLCSLSNGLFAARPAAFAESHNVERRIDALRNRSPFSMTNKGLSITLPLWRIPLEQDGGGYNYIALLGCQIRNADTTNGNRGEGCCIGIFLRILYSGDTSYHRINARHWIGNAPRYCGQATEILIAGSSTLVPEHPPLPDEADLVERMLSSRKPKRSNGPSQVQSVNKQIRKSIEFE